MLMAARTQGAKINFLWFQYMHPNRGQCTILNFNVNQSLSKPVASHIKRLRQALADIHLQERIVKMMHCPIMRGGSINPVGLFHRNTCR